MGKRALIMATFYARLADLPYIYSTEGKIKEPNLVAEAGQGLLSAVTSYARGDMGGVFSSLTKIAKTATGGGGKKAEEYSRRTKTSAADCVSNFLVVKSCF